MNPEPPAYRAFVDGASRGNPGESGIGIDVWDFDDNVRVATVNEYLGSATNNVAEYQAVITCINFIMSLPSVRLLVIYSDSLLVVNQLKGGYKIKNLVLRDMYAEVRRLLSYRLFSYDMFHVPRRMNTFADKLANDAIDHKCHHTITLYKKPVV